MSSTHELPQDYAQAQPVPVAYGDTASRLAFLRKVYALFGTTMAVWAGTTWMVMANEALLSKAWGMFGGGFLGMILLFGALFFVLRMTANSFPMNIIGLGIFGVFEGFLTAPLIYMAMLKTGGTEADFTALASGTFVPVAQLYENGIGIVLQAFVLTGAVFGGLTAYALTTKRDFSWMRGALWMGFWVLIAIAVMGALGIGGGLVAGSGFSMAWVLLMAGFVLYDTQQIMKRYPSNMAAAAAATLFIDFIIMFKHILMLLMNRD